MGNASYEKLQILDAIFMELCRFSYIIILKI